MIPLQRAAAGSDIRELQALQELEEVVGGDGQVVGGECLGGVAVAKVEGGQGAGLERVAAEGQRMNVEELSFEMMSKRDVVITGDV